MRRLKSKTYSSFSLLYGILVRSGKFGEERSPDRGVAKLILENMQLDSTRMAPLVYFEPTVFDTGF